MIWMNNRLIVVSFVLLGKNSIRIGWIGKKQKRVKMTQFKVLGPKDKQKIQNNNRRMLESIGCKGKAKNYKGTNCTWRKFRNQNAKRQKKKKPYVNRGHVLDIQNFQTRGWIVPMAGVCHRYPCMRVACSNKWITNFLFLFQIFWNIYWTWFSPNFRHYKHKMWDTHWSIS